MGILAWIIFGLIAGALAKFIMPGNDPGGCIVTTLLGIAGAVVGGFIGSLLGFGTVNEFDFRSFLLAIGGALLLLWLYRMFRGRRAV
ncbi:MAG TPA: GlsB/YeaQ/YmgE family stress response membrane protein [Rhodothermales bacterium]